MKITQVIANLDPRNGGPSVSVPRLSRALAERGHTVYLCSLAQQQGVVEREQNFTQLSFAHAWPARLSRSPTFAEHLKSASHDVIHSGGLWLRTLHYAHQAACAQGIPHVISPRGMMSPWAWRHHRLRKAAASLILHPGALSGASGFHATSEAEAEDIRALGFKQPVCVAPNGIDAPDPVAEDKARIYWLRACPEIMGRPVALFHSRFHCKKRVLELIDLWTAEDRGDWVLLMVGVPEQYTVEDLRDYVIRSGGAHSVLIADGSSTPAPYPIASLFLLPSLSENFGMVVAEALAHGVPVLVTDSTPWAEVNQTDFGWCGPWGQYAAALKASLALGPTLLRKRGLGAREWVCERYSWNRTAARLADFYSSLKAPQKSHA